MDEAAKFCQSDTADPIKKVSSHGPGGIHFGVNVGPNHAEHLPACHPANALMKVPLSTTAPARGRKSVGIVHNGPKNGTSRGAIHCFFCLLKPFSAIYSSIPRVT